VGASFESVDPRAPDARAALVRYLAETAENLADPSVGPAEVDDVDDFMSPGGVFVLVRSASGVIGCGALRTLGPGLGEIKRMWIDPEFRGQGYGSRLLVNLEDRARGLGWVAVRLDTNAALTDAVRLYESHGYRAVARYNDNPDATHFYEKSIVPAPRSSGDNAGRWGVQA
jgi:GNAT superfamily N-acetyltransferase